MAELPREECRDGDWPNVNHDCDHDYTVNGECVWGNGVRVKTNHGERQLYSGREYLFWCRAHP